MKKLTVCAGVLALMMGSASAAEQKSIEDRFAPFIPEKHDPPVSFYAQKGGSALALIYPTNDNRILNATTDQPEAVSIDRVGPALLVEVHQPGICGTMSVATTIGDRSFGFCADKPLNQASMEAASAVRTVANCLRGGGPRDGCEKHAGIQQANQETAQKNNRPVFVFTGLPR